MSNEKRPPASAEPAPRPAAQTPTEPMHEGHAAEESKGMTARERAVAKGLEKLTREQAAGSFTAGPVEFTFVRARILPAPRLGWPTARQLGAGVVGGILALIATVVFVYVLFPPNTVHWIDPVPWKIAGNVFSNFYEEFVYRGFMLVALGAAIGFWPAAIITSAMWGYTHNQYPLSLQALIMAVGVYFSWLMRKAQSLWTPYAAHMVLDIVGDSLIG